MHLEKKVRAVEKLFSEVDAKIASMHKKSGLVCRAGCGECCLNPGVEATVLEFLPAAFTLCKTGKCDTYRELLSDREGPVCVFYSPFAVGGMCSEYEKRGLICRLFGFSTRTDRMGEKKLITCRYVKADHDPEKLKGALNSMPEMRSAYMMLYGIDPDLAVRYYPVNTAILKAIDLVDSYLWYRKKPA
jgi:Fe-S-cluster containining protein